MSQENTSLALLKNELPTLTKLVLINLPQGATEDEANRVALREITNFEMMLQEKPDLKGCTPLSVLLAVKQCISDGLTLSQSSGLVYLYPRKIKTGIVNNADVYEYGVVYDPTANGRLSIAFQSGSILDVKRPTFTFDDKSGQLETVTVEFLVPSYPGPRWEIVVFTKMHFKKWADACIKKNNGKLNPNYTSWNGGIDPEFAGSKAIRHGLNKRGTNINGKRSMGTMKPFENIISEEAINKEGTEIIESEVVIQLQRAVHDGEAVIESITKNDSNKDLPV